MGALVGGNSTRPVKVAVSHRVESANCFYGGCDAQMVSEGDHILGVEKGR